MKVVHDNASDAWCDEFATLYRFETKLDMSVCVSVAHHAFRTHGISAPSLAVARVLAGKVTSTRPPVEALKGSFNVRRLK